jgi:hypothetical protein
MISCSQEGANPLGPEGNLPPEFSWLYAEGNKIVDENGKQVILHGVNRSGLEYNNGNGNDMSEGEYEFISNDWAVTVIRLPFNQDWITNDPVYQALVDRVIQWIKKSGAYVILDLQWQDTAVRIPPIPNTAAIDMWKKIADKYKDDPAIIYDIHNETHDIGFTTWRNRAIEIIDAIQSVHPDALILVSGMDWASDLTQWAANPLPHANIVYSAHVYPWLGGLREWDIHFGQYVDKFPIFIGEFGGTNNDVIWGKQLLSYLNNKQLGWTAWSWVDAPFLTNQIDRRTPTPFGQIVKDMLLRYENPGKFNNTISDVQISGLSADKVTIMWQTTLVSDTQVIYGLSPVYGNTFSATAMVRLHTAKLTGLTPQTMYHFKVLSRDEFGFVAESSDSTFTTLQENI